MDLARPEAHGPKRGYTGYMLSMLKRLDEVGFEKTRRALAALALSFFIILYLFWR